MAPSERASKVPWSMAGIFILLAIAVLVSGTFYFENDRQNQIRSTRGKLNEIADLKIGQIASWLEDRTGDAQMVVANPSFAQQAQQVLMGTAKADARQSLIDQMTTLHAKGAYKQVILLDSQGNMGLVIPQDSSPPQTSPFIRTLAAQSIETGEIVNSDIYTDPATHQVFLDILVPLGSGPFAAGPAAGTLLLRIDPDQSLVPLLQTWTVFGNTAESYLVRQDGDDLVYLTRLSARSDPPLTLTEPMVQTNNVAVRALTGQVDAASGVDYMGWNVLAATRKVPNTSWGLVTEVNLSEIDQPLAERETVALGFLVMLTLAATLAVGFIWRHRDALYYREQYQVEISNKAINEQLAYLSKYANDMILLMDENWNILEANDRAQSAYGYTLAELRRLGIRDLQTEANTAELRQQKQDMGQKGGIVFETIHRRKDYSSFPVECSARAIEFGEKIYVQSIIRDISARKEAEFDLRESERRFRLFYEQAPIAYQSLSADGCLIDVNKTWLKTMGFSMDEIMGVNFKEFLTADSRAAYEQAFQEIPTSGDLKADNVTVVRANHTSLISAVFGKATFDEFGHVKQIHCILHDITEQKEAEERIRRMNEELEQRVLERTAQLEAANRELEAFSYSVSHDLRAPLRAIDGFSRILSDEYAQELSADAQHYLERVRENTHTMSNLIDNLLSFSRLSRQPLNKQPIDPTTLIQQCLDLLNPPQDERPIEINVHPLPPCQADPALLKQVFINLLSNAIKFTGKKPAAMIEVGCLQENQENIYYVKDNGVGFDMQYAQKLFGVFQRLHRTEDYEGTGVGLAIVQRIIHRHGGRIWALSEPDQGATFCFTLDGATGNG